MLVFQKSLLSRHWSNKNGNKHLTGMMGSKRNWEIIYITYHPENVVSLLVGRIECANFRNWFVE